MHEMGIAMEVIQIVQASMPADMPAARVRRINLKVGKLSAVVVSSLSFCLEVCAKGTVMEGAELVIDEIPVTARCESCQHQWTLNQPVFLCPACNGADIKMLSGRELDIDSIEVEEPE